MILDYEYLAAVIRVSRPRAAQIKGMGRRAEKRAETK
jgi:hypothetical protein